MPTTTAARSPGAQAWARAIRDLPDLPYKVETNTQGQLILSPPKPEHSVPQGRIVRLLHQALGDVVGPEFAVHTSGGVKVPDVVWISPERYGEIPEGADASPVMPQICAEVLSSPNTEAEGPSGHPLAGKRQLYFEGGAEEVWIVSRQGRVAFHGPEGKLDASGLAPGFPDHV